jgi:5'-phosphate synthase pdxT subunit
LPNAAGEARGEAAARARVGVLSLQGDFERHAASLETLGVEPVRVTLPRDLEGVAALVIPGGESSAMMRLLETTGLRAPIEAFTRAHPVLGTCAGLILLGAGSGGLPAPTLGVLDVAVERNAYGRQIDSFSAEVQAPVVGGAFQGVFIRAPRIRRVGPGVTVVASRDGEPVGVRQGRAVGLCFHPELTGDLRFHRWFLGEVAGLALPAAIAASGSVSSKGAGSGGAVAGETR